MLIESCPMFKDELFLREENKLLVKDDLLDLFSYFNNPGNVKVDNIIQPYTSLTKWFFDIETEGLDPEIHAIKMIGNKLSNGKYLILDWTQYTESEMIQYFFAALEKVKPNVLTGYNIWSFDIPFIIRRCELLGITHPFWGGKDKCFRTAQKFGKPAFFKQYWLKGINIIDCYLQVLSKDYSERKLTGHSLKVVPVQWGIRTEIRTELSYKQMLECYDSNNVELMTKYLKDDLDDTQLVCDIVLPDIYYQQMFLPDWKLQSLATSGNGSKWNSILENFYGYSPQADPKLSFKGGFTQGVAGIYNDIEKLDVSSLYPSIMRVYGICSRKDPLAYQLRLLGHLTDTRLSLKAIAHQDVEANRMQSAMKIFINSAYGFLGVTGCSFNDMRAASLVTAYGRRIVKLMEKLILECGAIPIEVDTDGIIYSLNGKDGAYIHKYLNDNTPVGINIDREKLGINRHHADLIFIPPVMDKKGRLTYIENDFEFEGTQTIDTDEDNTDTVGNVLGLKKNYIYITKNEDTQSIKKFKIVANGKYKKRNISKFEKEFQVNCLSLLLEHGRELVFKYYQETIAKIEKGLIPYEDITVTRKASKAEKDVFKRGLVDDDGLTTYYVGQEVVKMKTKTKIADCKVNKGLYSVSFYKSIVERQFSEIRMFLND